MNTRVSDIAQAAGVSHGTIFVHFRSQEALIEEVVDVYGQKIALRTHALASSCGRLSELLRAHLDGMMEFEPFYTRLVIEKPAAASRREGQLYRDTVRRFPAFQPGAPLGAGVRSKRGDPPLPAV